MAHPRPLTYVWGKDVSGSLEGAGGVGGLLYVKRGGSVYVPLYDQGGNIVAYVDGATGSLVAEYEYDGFGNTVAASGTLVGAFHFRYSTKYIDSETGLIYYGYRYYAPLLGRWLTRDPLEEEGGLNLYAFCGNNGVNRYDNLGLLYSPIEAKAYWYAFAELYFRRYAKSPISADWLEFALAMNVGNRTVKFGENSAVAIAIQKSDEYSAVVGGAIKKQANGYFFHNVKTGISFKSGDLSTSIGKSDISFNGEVCKRKNGSAIVNLRVTLSNRYDFDFWGPSEFKRHSAHVVIGNDIACFDQWRGVIHPFFWSVTFDEKRSWPW